MKMSFEDEFGKYTVEVNNEALSLDEVISGLVIPLLRAAGYSEDADRRTGEQYDPEDEYERLVNEQWVKDIVKRLSEKR